MKQLATNFVEFAAIVMILITVALSTAALSQWVDQASAQDRMALPTQSGPLMVGGR